MWLAGSQLVLKFDVMPRAAADERSVLVTHFRGGKNNNMGYVSLMPIKKWSEVKWQQNVFQALQGFFFFLFFLEMSTKLQGFWWYRPACSMSGLDCVWPRAAFFEFFKTHFNKEVNAKYGYHFHSPNFDPARDWTLNLPVFMQILDHWVFFTESSSMSGKLG